MAILVSNFAWFARLSSFYLYCIDVQSEAWSFQKLVWTLAMVKSKASVVTEMAMPYVARASVGGLVKFDSIPVGGVPAAIRHKSKPAVDMIDVGRERYWQPEWIWCA